MLILAHPWILLMLPLPFLVQMLAAPRRETFPSVRVPFLQRLESAKQSTGVASPSQRNGLLGRWTTWILILFALTRPQWLEPPITRVIPSRDLLLLVDLSTSMSEQDFTDANGKPTDRLSTVKDVVGEFLSQREGDRVGLVVFGNAPFLQVPFSSDLELSRQLLDETQIGMAGPRTSLGDAIGLGIQLFANSDVPEKTMIALTDGVDNSSKVPPIEAAKVARDREITIHTIGMGDPTVVGEQKLDTNELKSIATVTGGLSFLALDRKELESVYSQLDTIETRELKTVGYQPRRDLFHWPIAIAVLGTITATIAGLVRKRRLNRTRSHPRRLRVNARTFELEVDHA